MLTFTFPIFFSLILTSLSIAPITKLPPFNIVHASSGLILHYLTEYTPSNRIISFTVSIPMTKDMCYLLPINVTRKIPRCHRNTTNSSRSRPSRPQRFITDIVSIGIGSAALALSTANTIQVLNLQHEVKTLTKSLSTLAATANTQTTHLLHLSEGQLKLAHELNHTQMALNRTIDLINDHADVLDRHSGSIDSLVVIAQYFENKLTALIHSVETHFFRTSLSDILTHHLNLHFIHHEDLPAVLDYIITATNVSFNPDYTLLPLVDLVSRLLVQQQIDFLPTKTPSTSRTDSIGVLSISSYFAATTPNQFPFSLYQLLPIPFPYDGLRVRLADMPYVIGLDFTSNHLIHWTQTESVTCDFRAMSVCRESPPIITDWNNTCLYQILTDTSLSACRTEQYLEPVFIHRLGDHWAISTNYPNHCHSISLSTLDQSYVVGNNARTLSPVALITIPPNTRLICDRFSISALPTVTGPSLTILDSSILNLSHPDVFDLYQSLSNVSRWPKLAYIPDNFKAIIDFIASTPPHSPLILLQHWYRHPLTYMVVALVFIIIILLGFLLYYRYIRPPTAPRVHLGLPIELCTIT